MQPSKLQNWLLAIRPKTLPASVAPVLMGTAIAYGDGIEDFPTAFLCLIGAMLLQIGTNLANDYFDFKKGTDTNERLGPVRVTQAGLIKPGVVLAAAIGTFILAGYISYLLIQRAGQPILIIAIVSIFAGIFYTAGPRPLGYLGLGDIFVLIFFGPVAVAGTYYAQSLEINMAVVLAGFGPGLLSTAILTVNNLRDADTDQRAGKLTLAVRFGKAFAQKEYLRCILGAAFVPVIIYLLIKDHEAILLSSIIGFLAIPAFQTVFTKTDGPSLNEVLTFTGKLLIVYSVLFSAGWIL
jgi:1,4-dihydroxy-2-naphthoate octaprenyltransferase